MERYSIALHGIDSYTKQPMYLPYKLDAASEAGICALNFPFKTTMFLSEKEGVVVRDGYGAPPVRI